MDIDNSSFYSHDQSFCNTPEQKKLNLSISLNTIFNGSTFDENLSFIFKNDNLKNLPQAKRRSNQIKIRNLKRSKNQIATSNKKRSQDKIATSNKKRSEKAQEKAQEKCIEQELASHTAFEISLYKKMKREESKSIKRMQRGNLSKRQRADYDRERQQNLQDEDMLNTQEDFIKEPRKHTQRLKKLKD